MIFRHLDRLLDSLLFIVLAAMSAIVAANVFCRFVLNFSIYWGDEAAQALLVWLTFLGAAVAVRERAHYRFDYLARRLRGRTRFLLAVVSRVIAIVRKQAETDSVPPAVVVSAMSKVTDRLVETGRLAGEGKGDRRLRHP